MAQKQKGVADAMIEAEMVTRRVQTRLERKRTGPHEWLVVTRRPLADEGRSRGKSSPEARDQDARYGYRYYLTPTWCSQGRPGGAVADGTGAGHQSGNMH